MSLFDGIRYKAKKRKFFRERVKWFKVSNLTASYEWSDLEGGRYKWYEWHHKAFLEGKLIFKSPEERFWWGHKEVIRRYGMDYQHSRIEFRFELK